jgi:hypothetical protein
MLLWARNLDMETTIKAKDRSRKIRKSQHNNIDDTWNEEYDILAALHKAETIEGRTYTKPTC